MASDVADFLSAHPPFDSLGRADVERAAAAAEVEFFLAGATIFAQDARPVEHLRVVRTGAVEIVLEDRVLDLLVAGELFGHASMLSGLPPGFSARAQEDTLCYRIPAQVPRTVLARPESVGFVARSLLEMHARLPASIAPSRRRAEPRRAMRIRRAPRGPGAAAYRSAHLPAGRTPWREASYCAVDLELSGLDPKRHEIVSFGAAPIEDGRVQLAGAVHGRVRPLRPISESSIRVHGLRDADLADAPTLDAAIDPLLAVMAGRIPIVHVAAIERGFLRPALRRQGLRLRAPMIDTSVLGLVWLHERYGGGPRHLPLSDLSRTLGLPSHHPHDAFGDALTTAQVFLALATHLDALQPQTVKRLTVADRRLRSLLAYPSR